MIVRLIKKGIIPALIPFSKQENPYDNVLYNKESIILPDPNETGYKRLQKLFQSSGIEPIHPSLLVVIQTCISSFIIGGIYGGITLTRGTFIHFIETNEATKFKSQFHAKRELRDKLHTAFFKGFVKFGMKTSTFCTFFIGAYTLISEYQNNDSALYYTPAGMFAGGLYKFPLGPKGVVSGAIFGSFFGSIYGCFKFLLLKITHIKEAELKRQKFMLKQKRDEAVAESKQKFLNNIEEKEMADLLRKY